MHVYTAHVQLAVSSGFLPGSDGKGFIILSQEYQLQLMQMPVPHHLWPVSQLPL